MGKLPVDRSVVPVQPTTPARRPAPRNGQVPQRKRQRETPPAEPVVEVDEPRKRVDEYA